MFVETLKYPSMTTSDVLDKKAVIWALVTVITKQDILTGMIITFSVGPYRNITLGRTVA
jgi:hypothetical protein